jgi:hypothetical protein
VRKWRPRRDNAPRCAEAEFAANPTKPPMHITECGIWLILLTIALWNWTSLLRYISLPVEAAKIWRQYLKTLFVVHHGSPKLTESPIIGRRIQRVRNISTALCFSQELTMGEDK